MILSAWYGAGEATVGGYSTVVARTMVRSIFVQHQVQCKATSRLEQQRPQNTIVNSPRFPTGEKALQNRTSFSNLPTENDWSITPVVIFVNTSECGFPISSTYHNIHHRSVSLYQPNALSRTRTIYEMLAQRHRTTLTR